MSRLTRTGKNDKNNPPGNNKVPITLPSDDINKVPNTPINTVVSLNKLPISPISPSGLIDDDVNLVNDTYNKIISSDDPMGLILTDWPVAADRETWLSEFNKNQVRALLSRLGGLVRDSTLIFYYERDDKNI